MAYPPPKIIGHGAEQMRLLGFVELPPGERKMANGSLANRHREETYGLALCQDLDGSCYLFTCNEQWRVMFDGWFANSADAIEHVKVDYPAFRFVK